ncbi:hypothetical protein IE81DRAFT_326803 [Ceraceosorus guamensis]|uniref:GST C-terminal domain-containing protein n=1 Tax=Ceraceosorus guamensis TaxID=1522189 RepID=A0A316VPD3_9BASI|nr:hypothetical protein IE81DRAFT_326803 [Ceraceosorus guamensis]PWN39174.1 hypothetical protein IE81DRAFT_326803 [Ceraceosorus guamensis]
MASTSTSPNNVPKANLYTFKASVWGAVATIGLVEKGYAPDDVDLRSVVLPKGENFAPAYLRINPNATVPSLVVPLADTTSAEVDTKFRALNDSVAVLEFLDSSRSQQILDARGETGTAPAPMLAPATIEGKAASDALIALVHQDDADPNGLLLAVRDEKELEAAVKGFHGTFVKGRFEALKTYRAETAAQAKGPNPRDSAITERLLNWYDERLLADAPLYNTFIAGDSTAQKAFIEQSINLWVGLAKVLSTLEERLVGPLALGDQIALADIHLMAYLARIFQVAQGLPLAPKGDEILAVDAAFKHPAIAAKVTNAAVGPKVTAYWQALKQRPSFKQEYADGLH